MLYGQGVLHQVVDPKSLFCRLAFRAMPVATTVVTIAHRATFFACLFVPTKGSSTATGYFAQYL